MSDIEVKGAKNKAVYILFIFYIPLLLIEWFVDMIVELVKVFHSAVETLTLSLKNYIHEPTEQKPPN